MGPRWTRPDARIDAVRGCVAVERGPLVYCAESLDDDPPLSELRVDTSVPPADRQANGSGLNGSGLNGSGLDGVVVTVAAARTSRPADGGAALPAWPYGDPPPEPGPARAAPAGARPTALVPYHLWGNRGPATMRVWLPEDT
jgi:DUF1680 family protein